MQRLATRTSQIGTIIAITVVTQAAAQAATVPQPVVTLATRHDSTVTASTIQAVVQPSPSPSVAIPESTRPLESVQTESVAIAQTLVDNASSSSAQVWTIETTPVQSAPTQITDALVTAATKPVWTEGSTVPNADVATADLPLTPEMTPIAPVSPDPLLDGTVTAQLPSPAEAAALQGAIDNYEPLPKRWLKPYKSSPGITLAVPSGFGADRGKMFVGVGVQRTRLNTNDGSGGIGLGLGNAQTGLGVQISYTSYSISPGKLLGFKGIVASDRPFGSGGFNLKIHKRFPGGLSVAVGADSILNIGPKAVGLGVNGLSAVQNEVEGTYYAAATKLFQLKPDATEPFSRLAVTVGAGTGRFQPEQTLRESRTVITPFASAALKISPAASFIAEWTGQDFGVGLSWVPFRNLPFVITPGFRDLFGPDATKPRFVLGFGLSL
jgi:hypothetical protein